MKLQNKANFDLHFDIKNLPELEKKVEQYENPKNLMDLMLMEIVDLNIKLAESNQKLRKLGYKT